MVSKIFSSFTNFHNFFESNLTIHLQYDVDDRTFVASIMVLVPRCDCSSIHINIISLKYIVDFEYYTRIIFHIDMI